ncbi:hypothetical protein J7F03_28440 [Streptomyces sp. ISL-43]|uniref:hypothetical protein n=1 Tax=Streptomyces sp. ISL-43 TaxID=2819183 RepID=UPI001BEABC46|nr:hypothetical protein [Streptomyces sp. ISL-43]MBT2450934.1 hypothetical protein [Streptomyces sp. ISL-43]
MPIAHSTFVAGDKHLIARMVSNYQCGHCTGEVTHLATNGNDLHAGIEHDDGCPVLAGTLPAAPDLARAARVPDTFRR